MADNLERVRMVFLEAVEHHAPEMWLAFLDEACGDDLEVRRQVEVLLEAHVSGGSLLEKGAIAADLTTDERMHERAGVQIGPYKLQQKIGEGGMGAVYLAEQHVPVKRKVALKVIKPGMDSRQVIARFEAERQALSLMDHPNIAKVLDAGTTEQGRPYFVMELVKGRPITEYCDEKRLPPRQRLELFVSACHAIQHAHQKGIIHRDIKPSNVMVADYDEKPVVKVIDFGVAKALYQPLTEKSVFTHLGQLLGTPVYMSPEQAKLNQLDIDTRSDIYSLGVLLYELLTGATPIDRERLRSAAWDEMLRIIREEEPPRPSTKLSGSDSLASVSANRQLEPARLTKLVHGELDWIVMKALEKERGRRYETANGFALDVQRYLADEPVQACPPSAIYRLRKFARRNKGALALSAGILLFLMLLGSGVGWVWRDHLAREAEAARQQRERHAKAAGQIELILAEADRLAMEQQWLNALLSVRRAEAVLQGGEVDDTTMARVLQRLKDLEWIDKLEHIRLLQSASVGHSFDYAASNREYAKAFAHYGVSIDDLTVAAAIEKLKAQPSLAVPIGAALDDWARARAQTDAEGGDCLIDVARGVDPEPLRLRLRATRQKPAREVEDELCRLADAIDVKTAHPATLQILGGALRHIGRMDRGVSLLLAAQRAHPGDFWVNFELAHQLQIQKDDAGAARFYTAALAIRPQVSIALSNLGNSLCALGKFDEAVAAHRRAIELDPTSSLAQSNLGGALSDQGKLDEAVAAHRRAIELDPNSAIAHGNLGKVLLALKKPEEAAAAHRRAIELDANYAIAHNNLGNALTTLGKLDEAAAAFKRAIELDSSFAGAHYNFGILLRNQGMLDEATAAFRKAIELDPKNADARGYLATTLYRKRDLPGAVKTIREAIGLAPNDAAFHIILGNALRDDRKTNEAVDAYRRAIELNPNNADARTNMAIELHALGRRNEAEEQFREALAIRERLAADSPNVLSNRVHLGGAYCNFGLWLGDAGQVRESLPWFNKAIDTMQSVLETDPRHAMAQEYLWKSHSARAMAQDRLENYAEALKDWDKVVELSSSPQRPFARTSRAISLAHGGQAAEAVAEVADLLNFTGLPASTRYDVACIYSLASAAVAEKRTEYADQAMKLLEQAVTDGFQDAAHMKQDHDLDALRDREDFKKLLTELETNKQ